jgi:hypothetical protein
MASRLFTLVCTHVKIADGRVGRAILRSADRASVLELPTLQTFI